MVALIITHNRYRLMLLAELLLYHTRGIVEILTRSLPTPVYHHACALSITFFKFHVRPTDIIVIFLDVFA